MRKTLFVLSAALFLTAREGYSETALFLGNSLSAQAYYSMAAYAQSMGKTLDAQNANPSGQFIAGVGLGLYWNNYGVHINAAGDALFIQTYQNGSDLGIEAETRLIGNYYTEARSKNSNCVCFVYCPYPTYNTSQAAWNSEWSDASPLDGPGYAQNYNAKIFHETLMNNVRDNFPGATVLMLPLGHILEEASSLIAQGKYPDVTAVGDFYSSLDNGVPNDNGSVNEGEVHFGRLGIYLQIVTQYVLIFKDKPHGGMISDIPLPNTGDKFSVSQEFAQTTWDIVWNTLVANPNLSGVTGTPVVSTVLPRANGARFQRAQLHRTVAIGGQASNGLNSEDVHTIDGRRVPTQRTNLSTIPVSGVFIVR